MRYRNIISKPDAPTPIFPAALPAIAFLAWALILIMLAVGLLVAPTQMAYAIAILGLGTPLLWLVWHRSEFGLLGLVFLTSNFLPADTLELRLPIGGLDSRDLGLLGMLGMLLLHRAMRKRSLIFWLPIAGPLLIFLGLAIFSALYALLYRDGEFNWTLGELRTIMYYAVFFVTAWTITEQRQLVILLAGLFLLTDVIALILILQQFLGTTNPLLSVMMLGNTWLVWDAGDPTATFGGVRIIPPGHVLMYLM